MTKPASWVVCEIRHDKVVTHSFLAANGFPGKSLQILATCVRSSKREGLKVVKKFSGLSTAGRRSIVLGYKRGLCSTSKRMEGASVCEEFHVRRLC